MRPWTPLTVAIIYVAFAAASALAGLVGVLSLLSFDTSRISRITRAMDCLVAAMLGFDGRSTLSAECGRRASSCLACRRLCQVLHIALEKGHCEKEAL